MAKIIKLTEKDLTRIVKSIVNEQSSQQTTTPQNRATGWAGGTPINMDAVAFLTQFNGREGNYWHIDKGFNETYITFGMGEKKYKVKF